MATIKINELGAGTPVSTDLVPFADPTTGLAEKATITQIATLIEPLLTGKADLNGDSTETFEVADATSSTEAVNKGQLDVAINALQGSLIPQGNWDASTNTPDITGTTTTGYYWIVSVDGSTSLGGITDWKVNDWAVKTATGWAKIDNSESVTSVSGKTGAVTLDLDDVSDSATRFALTNSAQTIDGEKTFTEKINLNDFGEILGVSRIPDGGDIEFYTKQQGSGGLFNSLILTAAATLIYTDDFAFTGTNFNVTTGIISGNGSGLTTLNASNITSGTLADARLSTNVALKDQDNNFSVEQTAPNFNGKFDNITLQDLSLSQSLLESWARTRETAGDTYFPNEGAYSLALDKSLGIKPVIDLIPSAINTNVIRVYNKDTSKDLTSSRTSTATYVDQFGEIETAATGVPRIDYTNGVGELLLEPQSTNLITTSNNGSYGGGGSPTSEINEISPSGGNNAIRPVPALLSNRYECTIPSGTYSTNTKITYSWYRKRISTPLFDSFVGDLDIKALVNCTQDGITTQISSDINGYDRFQAVFNITDGALSTTLRLYYGSVIGVGNSSVAYWGHQAEPLSYATSLMQTSGSSVTRIADAVTGNSSLGQVINSSEGVLYFEASILSISTIFKQIGIGDGTSNNRILLEWVANTQNFSYNVIVGGISQASGTFALTSATDYNKIALKYKTNDFALWVNGVEVLNDNSGNTFASNTLTTLSLDNTLGTNSFYGRIRELKVYDTALTDAELTTLTTI